MMKDLGARAFNYGYASPVLMVATYNDDGSVNVMNLHECTRTNAGHLALCIGKPKKDAREHREARGIYVDTGHEGDDGRSGLYGYGVGLSCA